ncbi:hypothetical protein F8M41_023375 [Gigaspora margarita]|uniref:Uncharacterized protein n=1 Tax=Gigaspora margarita TaxID=4874 RepID=A0A8H4EHB0_GIGMA|nr:hypothetical protein F8M41_023375 [Gigaspora margarita]
MFQEMKVTVKKSSKKDSSKKSNRGKASLEKTRGSELTQSFSERFDNLRIGSSNTYENSNTSESRTLAKIIENQGEILHQLQELNSKVRRLENRFWKIRALRGTLTTKIKSSTFFVFGNLLEPINNHTSPEMVLKWKRSEKIKACYRRLFNEVDDSGVTYMVKILTKIWPSGDSFEENVAYAIAVAQAILNPKYKKIMMSDTVIKHKIAKNLDILKHNTGFSLLSSEDETEKEKSNKKSDNVEKTYKRPIVETTEEEQEDQEDSPKDLKEAEQVPEDNDSNNVKKEPVRKNKNISKKFSKIYKRPKTSEIEQEDQKELSEDSNEAKNEPENNDSRASSSSSSDYNNDSKKETDDDSKKETDESYEYKFFVFSFVFFLYK